MVQACRAGSEISDFWAFGIDLRGPRGVVEVVDFIPREDLLAATSEAGRSRPPVVGRGPDDARRLASLLTCRPAGLALAGRFLFVFSMLETPPCWKERKDLFASVPIAVISLLDEVHLD